MLGAVQPGQPEKKQNHHHKNYENDNLNIQTQKNRVDLHLLTVVVLSNINEWPITHVGNMQLCVI